MTEKTPVERIQHVAFQLSVMSAGAPPQGSLSKMLGDMAADLNGALAALGHRTSESANEGMARALSVYGIYGVNRLFLGVTYEGHPEIAYLAVRHDWADAELAFRIAKWCVIDMLGISEREFLQQWGVNRAGLLGRFYEAHERWS